MIAKGLCSVLASDYYYPAPLLAAFRLAADGVLPLAESLGSDLGSAGARRRPSDRGVLAAGRRADIILVDDAVPLRPRIVAVIAAGRLVHLADASCSGSSRAAQGGCGGVSGSMLRAMADSPRYAIYYAPAPGSALDRFGAHLLGYDAYDRRPNCPFRDGILSRAGLAGADAATRANTAFTPR